MNSTINDQITGGQNLAEPHFDEEATILAARPVVPLDEVKAQKRSKAGVAVALAVGGGLLIGLLAATLIYRYLGANQVPRGETTTVAEQAASPIGEQTTNPLPSPAGGAVVDDSAVTSVEDAKPAETDTEKREPKPEVEESKPVKTQDRAPEVGPRRPMVVRESRPPADEEKDEEAERAIRRAERQEDRHERRRAVREARRQERQSNQTADDLTRIREIFEGAPKP